MNAARRRGWNRWLPGLRRGGLRRSLSPSKDVYCPQGHWSHLSTQNIRKGERKHGAEAKLIIGVNDNFSGSALRKSTAATDVLELRTLTAHLWKH